MTTATQPASRKEKAIQTTTERASSLFFDGYRAEPYPDRPGVYAVYQPEGRKLPKGCSLWYDVDIANGECDCTGFEVNGTCKHYLGVLKAVADALRLVSPMLPTTVAATVKDLNEYATLPNEPKPGDFNKFDRADFDRPALGTPEYRRMMERDFA